MRLKAPCAPSFAETDLVAGSNHPGPARRNGAIGRFAAARCTVPVAGTYHSGAIEARSARLNVRGGAGAAAASSQHDGRENDCSGVENTHCPAPDEVRGAPQDVLECTPKLCAAFLSGHKCVKNECPSVCTPSRYVCDRPAAGYDQWRRHEAGSVVPDPDSPISSSADEQIPSRTPRFIQHRSHNSRGLVMMFYYVGRGIVEPTLNQEGPTRRAGPSCHAVDTHSSSAAFSIRPASPAPMVLS